VENFHSTFILQITFDLPFGCQINREIQFSTFRAFYWDDLVSPYLLSQRLEFVEWQTCLTFSRNLIYLYMGGFSGKADELVEKKNFDGGRKKV
jgi:hypothetical protein